MMEFDLNDLKKKMNGGGIKEESKKQRNNNNSNLKSRQGNSYIGAPYNFVSFSNKVYQCPENLTSHQEMREELATGEITYEITAVTPIFVDDGTGEFYTNPNGEYSIPGSTMRGLIRNNVQILGLASLFDDIDDYSLMYRNVAAGLQQKRYNEVLGAGTVPLNTGTKNKQVSVLKNVKAGYLRRENGKYYIYKTVVDKINSTYGEMNYYPLSERKIIEDYLNLGDKEKFSYGYFNPKAKNVLQNEFQRFKKTEKSGKVQYEGMENRTYEPYMREISYQLKGLKNVIAVGASGRYEKKGYVVSTGKMRLKKMIYIIPDIDETKQCIEIPEEDVLAFQIDYKKRENKLKKKEFFNLPKEGETKPVFYIYLNGRLYFGFTPRLRLFYDHTIKEGLNDSHKEGIIDYSKVLFGYSDEKKSYKTKLSFTDAVLESTDQAVVLNKSKVILGEPNPTSCLEYVKPKKGNPDTYNSNDFKLRGIKQYWLHKDIMPHEVEEKQKRVASDLHPIRKGVKFRGKIRFQNLTKDELGLLLWSVRLNKESEMNVGKAKSFGYGRIKLNILEAKKVDRKKAYMANSLELEPFEPIEIEKAIKDYKDTINQFTGSVPIDEMPQIKEFFVMKDSTKIPSENKTRYMNLDEYKRQIQTKSVLPSIQEVIKGQEKKG